MVGVELVRAARRISSGLFNALAELGTLRTAPPLPPSDAAARLAYVLGTIARSHDLVVAVRGRLPDGPALLVSNHVSYLDPLVILPVCPAIPVSKGEVAGWPIIGPIGKAFGSVYVDRDQPMGRVRALREIHHVLASGASVLNFPEGTTTTGERVLPFWRGSFGIAQRLDLPIVPIALRYRDPTLAWCNDATFLPHYLKMSARAELAIELEIGEAMHVRTGEAPERAAARAREAIARTLDRMRRPDAGCRDRLSAPRPDAVLPAARLA